MSSDKSQTQVGGSAAAPGASGSREGGLSAAQKRAAVANASVSVRLKDDAGEAQDAALTDSTFMAKTDGDLKNLSGFDLLTEMMNNPLMQAKSGTAWAQVSIARAGLDKELDKLIEGTPVVEERQCYENIQQLLSTKTLPEMSKTQVIALQMNLERLGLFSGKADGDFGNAHLVAGLDGLVHRTKVIEDAMKGGARTLDIVWDMRHGTEKTSPEKGSRVTLDFTQAQLNKEPKMYAPVPEGGATILQLFKENRDEMTVAAKTLPPAPQPTTRPQNSLVA